MKYFDGFVVPVPKKNLSFTAASPRRREKSGGSTAPLNTANAAAMTSTSRWGFHFRE